MWKHLASYLRENHPNASVCPRKKLIMDKRRSDRIKKRTQRGGKRVGEKRWICEKNSRCREGGRRI